MVHLTKERSPHRHFRIAVRGDIGAELNNAHDVGYRKSPSVVPAQHGQVRRLLFQSGCNGAIAFPVCAMACRAIVCVHRLAAGGRGRVDRDRNYLRVGLVGAGNTRCNWARDEYSCRKCPGRKCKKEVFQHRFPQFWTSTPVGQLTPIL